MKATLSNFSPRIKEVFTFDEIKRVNFSNPEARRTEMNAFVKKYTNCINELLPIDSVQNDGNFVLVNAAFFKGFLKKPFNVKNTDYQYFYGASEQIIETMYAIGMYNYGVFTVMNVQSWGKCCKQFINKSSISLVLRCP